MPWVIIDHRPLESLSPAAALVLLATLYRANYLRRNALVIDLMIPSVPGPRDLLGQIGYYRYCSNVEWRSPEVSPRYFLEHRKGTKVQTGVAEEICQTFTDEAIGGRGKMQRLYEALIEGMGNAEEWGYGKKPGGYQMWWVIAYRNDASGEIGYSFYDQGNGIPATIRRKRTWSEYLPFMSPKDSELVIRGVVEGRFSRTKIMGRGTGLPRLLKFIDDGADGELLIFSDRCRCVFKHGRAPEKGDYSIALRGTLISWSFRP